MNVEGNEGVGTWGAWGGEDDYDEDDYDEDDEDEF
jgi:hypothetical protein